MLFVNLIPVSGCSVLAERRLGLSSHLLGIAVQMLSLAFSLSPVSSRITV